MVGFQGPEACFVAQEDVFMRQGLFKIHSALDNRFLIEYEEIAFKAPHFRQDVGFHTVHAALRLADLNRHTVDIRFQFISNAL